MRGIAGLILELAEVGHGCLEDKDAFESNIAAVERVQF